MTTTTTPTEPYTAETFRGEWEKGTTALSKHGAAEAGLLYTAWSAGKITTPEWRRLFAVSLLRNQANGIAVGDGLATRLLHLAHGRDVLPLQNVLDVEAELTRLDKAVSTLESLIDGAEDPRPRIERLATSEPVNAAQQAAVKVYDLHEVIGWRRQTDADPCELCVWLVKAHLDPAGIGYVYPTDKSFHRHPGCQCAPVPVTERTES